LRPSFSVNSNVAVGDTFTAPDPGFGRE